MMKRSRNRELSREERDLWAFVTRHDKRMHGKPNTDDAALPEAATSASKSERGVHQPTEREPILASNTPPNSAFGSTPATSARAAYPRTPPLADFESRRAKLIARERLRIDARLDLHGLRKSDAHAALRRFLRHCQAEGHRHVLVITGKGNAGAESERDFWQGEERGVLRRLVPHWLTDSECRSFVVSFTEAGPRHGGSGALYVTIRKPQRSRG
jgi:DNA-nicking Smr family endonuclease